MKTTIRHSTFETNSSSVHSLTMCSESEWEKWERGELLYDDWQEEFVDKNDIEDSNGGRYYTMDDFFDKYNYDYETFNTSYTTPNGETVRAFGYYGFD